MTSLHPRTAFATAVATTLAVAALGVAGASGQDGEQAIGISVAGGQATLTGADALHPGPAAITVAATPKELDLTIFELKPGVTQDQVLAAAAKLKGPPTSLQQYGKFVYGSSTGKGKPYTAGLTLDPATYLLIDATRAPKLVGSFTVAPGAASGTAPTPDATVTMKDFKIKAPATLPSTGLVRFENKGKSPHFVAVARAASKAKAEKVAELLHMGKEKQAGKLITGDTAAVGLISPGVANDVPFKAVKKGYYVLVCFYGDSKSHGKEHSMLGMETVVRVK